MEQFEDYAIQELKKTKEEVVQMYEKMKQILAATISAGKQNLKKKYGQFQLLGCDIMVDSDFNPILIEINSNPALCCDTKVQKTIIPAVIRETLDIVLQLNKSRRIVDKQMKKNLLQFHAFQKIIYEPIAHVEITPPKYRNISHQQKLSRTQNDFRNKLSKLNLDSATRIPQSKHQLKTPTCAQYSATPDSKMWTSGFIKYLRQAHLPKLLQPNYVPVYNILLTEPTHKAHDLKPTYKEQRVRMISSKGTAESPPANRLEQSFSVKMPNKAELTLQYRNVNSHSWNDTQAQFSGSPAKHKVNGQLNIKQSRSAQPKQSLAGHANPQFNNVHDGLREQEGGSRGVISGAARLSREKVTRPLQPERAAIIGDSQPSSMHKKTDVEQNCASQSALLESIVHKIQPRFFLWTTILKTLELKGRAYTLNINDFKQSFNQSWIFLKFSDINSIIENYCTVQTNGTLNYQKFLDLAKDLMQQLSTQHNPSKKLNQSLDASEHLQWPHYFQNALMKTEAPNQNQAESEGSQQVSSHRDPSIKNQRVQITPPEEKIQDIQHIPRQTDGLSEQKGSADVHQAGAHLSTDKLSQPTTATYVGGTDQTTNQSQTNHGAKPHRELQDGKLSPQHKLNERVPCGEVHSLQSSQLHASIQKGDRLEQSIGLPEESGENPKDTARALVRHTFNKIREVMQAEKINSQFAFHSFDQDQDQRISFQELTYAFSQMRFGLSQSQVKSIMDYCDQDQDGYLNYDEFTKTLQL